MTADESGIKIDYIGYFQPDTSSDIIALYIDIEAKYVCMMYKNGAFHYFEYDADQNNMLKRITNGKVERDFQG